MESLAAKVSSILLSCLLLLQLFSKYSAGQAQEHDTISTISTMEKLEQDALYGTIQGFLGDWWNGTDLYPDPCGWTPIQGVDCEFFNGYWYVTTVSVGMVLDNLVQCNETAKFSHHLFQLKHLKSLSLINCFTSTNRSTILPSSEWQALSYSLETLELRSNPGLTGTIPLSIGSLKQLQSLVLVENGLSGKLPAELGSLSLLKKLVLSGNQFWGEIPQTFGSLSHLLILDLSTNSLSGSPPLTLGALTSLIKLDLSNNKLNGKLPNLFSSLQKLVLLDIGGNNFTGGLVQSLQELGSLNVFVASNNVMLGGDIMGIQWDLLQNLEYLDISTCGLGGTIPDSLVRMKSLRFLGLNENNLSGNISPNFERMANLGALYLNDNRFSGILQFQESFYMKMGRRLGVWNNGNLCYFGDKGTPSLGPYGVTPCQHPTTS